MYVKVQHRNTIKKMPIRQPETASVADLLQPFKQIRTIEDAVSDTGVYGLKVADGCISAGILVETDSDLRRVLREASKDSKTLKLIVRDRSIDRRESSDSFEVVTSGADSKNDMADKLANRKFSSDALRGPYMSEEINIGGITCSLYDRFNQSMIEMEELNLRRIKEQLYEAQDRIRKLESKMKLTNIKQLLDEQF